MRLPDRPSLAPARFAAIAVFAVSTSGCAVMDSNVKGNFTCRAPEGTCAPTSVIDAAATKASEKVAEPVHSVSSRSIGANSDGRLQIVLAAYRDENGRTHEARVVAVALPATRTSQFTEPASRREVARALARAVDAARHTGSVEEAPRSIGLTANPASDPATTRLPDVLTAPLQHAPAGGSGTASLPAQVPHLDPQTGDLDPQEGHVP
ncbi:hypothetical protein [Novosphingobium sp.]|uniref:hypothetical protein n=1 Tax=Novosphingobium sp. TaxID=1874826 RepID=UPI002602A521|nr:hypothetical protein [Novosphingobium sp.]